MKSSIVLFVCACVLSAGEIGPAGIAGRVTDTSGAVVPGVSVKLTSRGGDNIAVTTDPNGQFRADSLTGGEYDLSAESAGFARFSRSAVLLQPGQTLTFDLVLQIPSLSEQVSVTAKAPAGEGALETSSRNSHEVLEIREVRESSAKDAGEALANLDGVWKIRRGGIANDVVLRGFQQGNISVLIDGQRIYGACPNHMDPSAYHVDFAEIASIEVTKGPFNVRDQGSLGGSVNIVQKKPLAGFHVTPNLSVGSFGFYNPSLVASVSRGRFYGLAGYSFRRSEPYVDGSGLRITSYANYTTAVGGRPGFHINTGWGRFGAELTHNQNLELSYTRQSGGLTLYPGLQMDSPYDNADRINANWNLKELTGVVKQVRAQAYFSRVGHWMTDELRTGAAGTSLGYSMAALAGSKVTGARLEAELADTIFGLEAYNRSWDVVNTMRMNMVYTAQPALPGVRVIVGGAYAQHRRNIGGLSVTLGGRLDAAASEARSRTLNPDIYWAYHNTRSTSASDVNPSGFLRLTYLLPGGIVLFGGGGTSVRLPDPEERYYELKRATSDWVGNPNLEPTRNNEADLGLNLRSRRFSLRPTLFYSRLSNFVALTLQPKINPVMSVMNSSARSYEGVEAQIYGGEVSYSVEFTRALLLTGGVSYTRGKQFAKPEAGLPGGNIAEMPPLKSRAALRYGSSRFFAEINGLASARQDKVDSRLREPPSAGYALLGLKAGIHHKQWNFSGGVDNLANRFYYEFLSYQRDPFRTGVRIPEPGRTFYLNVSMTFE